MILKTKKRIVVVLIVLIVLVIVLFFLDRLVGDIFNVHLE
jgi:preprotein translocase subunit SecE